MEDRLELFKRSYDRNAVAVYRLAMVYTGNRTDAEDVTQETFVRLYKRDRWFDDQEQERRWLLRVTANLCIDLLRGPWRKRVAPLDELPDVQTEDRHDGLAEAVLALPGKLKGPIHLHYFEGYSVEETAKILGISVPAVKMRLKRAREALKKELED